MLDKQRSAIVRYLIGQEAADTPFTQPPSDGFIDTLWDRVAPQLKRASLVDVYFGSYSQTCR